MKKLILFLAIFISFNGYAENTVDKLLTKAGNIVDSTKQAVKEGVATVDTSSNFKMIYSDLKDGLGALASSLKVGAEHVYMVLVKQQVVYSIVYLLLLLLSIVLMAISLIMYNKSESDDWEFPTIKNLAIVGFFVVSVASGLIGVFHIDNIITGFVNPEYGAVQDLISFVQGNSNGQCNTCSK